MSLDEQNEEHVGGWHALKGRDSLATTPFQGVPPELITALVRQNPIDAASTVDRRLSHHGPGRAKRADESGYRGSNSQSACFIARKSRVVGVSAA